MRARMITATHSVPSTRRRLARLTIATALLVAVGAGPSAIGSAQAEPAPAAPITMEEEAELQAEALAAEDRRLIEVRTVTSLARWQGKNWKTPYRLGTPAGYTLVLTPKSSPYTIEDLLQLAPQTFVRMSDGSFLLTEHVVVMARATLRLSAPGGLTLRLSSGHGGFATIASLGGKLEIVGEEGAPVTLTSWDADAGAPDDLTTDGRAYLRAIGGQFEATHVHASHLGFWSGRTGGIALTGTDRPNTGAIESVDPGEPPAAGGGGPPALLDDLTWQPAGPLPETPEGPSLDYSVPSVDYVSSRLSHVTVEHSAFGLFVSGANGVKVIDSAFNDNQHGGVVLHRYVTNGVISRTISNRNGGDGFTLARATTGISISESTASDNRGSGFSLDGRPLADGPSAVGASLRSYGNNSLSNSAAANNGHYGIELLGGFNIGVLNNSVAGHDMGIMINGPAERISITGNTVRQSERHGLALVNGVASSMVTGNVIEGSTTGIYVRASRVEIKGNTVQNAESHGVSLIGNVDGSEVAFNVLAGRGSSALDTIRSEGLVTNTTNNLDGWHDTTPWYLWFKKLLQPMNALWSALAILIIISAVRSRKKNGILEHPYAQQILPQPRVVDLTGTRAVVLE